MMNVVFLSLQQEDSALVALLYLNLKRWATGDLKHLFQDPPRIC